MKEKPNDHVDMSDPKKVEEWPEDFPGSSEEKSKGSTKKGSKKGKDSQAWRKHHNEAIDNTNPDLYPKLWELSGARGKISLSPFQSHIQDAHSIFDSNRRVNFRNLSHVYHTAFYRGMEDLKYQFLEKKRIPLSRMSKLLMANETRREEENEIGRAVEEIKDYFERLKKGWISEDEYEKKEAELMAAFADSDLKERVKAAIDNLFSEGENEKAGHRLYVKNWRAKVKASKLKVVE